MTISPAVAHAICRSRNVYADPKRSLAITAEALKTITNPTKTKISVMQKIQRSMLTRLATAGRASAGGNLFQREDALLEDPPAMLVVLELIEAGASRSKQHDIAGGCRI